MLSNETMQAGIAKLNILAGEVTLPIPLTVYAIEECSEFIKACTKHMRGKADAEQIKEEGIDVLLTVCAVLNQLGVTDKDIEEQVECKRKRP